MSQRSTAELPVPAPPAGLTQHEQARRDRALRFVVDRLPAGLTPNHLTRLRILLVIVAIVLYAKRAALFWQAVLLVAAALTDLVDGPLARLRGLGSLEGARLDRRADSLLTGWLVALTLLEGSAPLPLLLALAAGQLAALGSDPSRRARLLGRTEAREVAPRPTLAARLQLALVVAGLWLLVVHTALGWRTRRVAEWLLLGGLGATGARIAGNLQGTLRRGPGGVISHLQPVRGPGTRTGDARTSAGRGDAGTGAPA